MLWGLVVVGVVLVAGVVLLVAELGLDTAWEELWRRIVAARARWRRRRFPWSDRTGT